MANLLVMCQMVASKTGKTGLTDVTVDVDSYDPISMTRSVVVTDASATESRNGRYHYWIQNYDESLVYAVDFKTADSTVDQKHLAAFAWDGASFHKTELSKLDMSISDIPTASENADAVFDESATGHSGWIVKLLSVTKFLGLK